MTLIYVGNIFSKLETSLIFSNEFILIAGNILQDLDVMCIKK